jgi:glutamate N-acetyltransferase/amino-acid N-acetyltransferase
MTIEPIAGGITTPVGVRASGVACGIKQSGLDLALIVPDRLASAAGVFTTNRAQAAPVIVSREHLASSCGRAGAILINSGCANACTGEEGLIVARAAAAEVAAHVGCRPHEVLVASTGVIGVALDGHKIVHGIRVAHAGLSPAGAEAARAIMTTDPFPKERAARVKTSAGSFTIGGMAKGSGMIEPRMATMIGVVATDAEVEPDLLADVLREVVETTFNAITVDGECSTNDCVLLLATGQSGVSIDRASRPALVEGLLAVCRPLALDIVRGGEGATKLVSITVSGAASAGEAWQAARAIANSPLCKTAVHGGDPNWGRFIAAAGRAGVAFDLSHAGVWIGTHALFSEGRPHDERASDAARDLQRPEIEVRVDLGTGGAGSARVWTCDLSEDYVRINAGYRT